MVVTGAGEEGCLNPEIEQEYLSLPEDTGTQTTGTQKAGLYTNVSQNMYSVAWSILEM